MGDREPFGEARLMFILDTVRPSFVPAGRPDARAYSNTFAGGSFVQGRGECVGLLSVTFPAGSEPFPF